MKNILHIIGSLDPGGAEILLLDICNNIRKTNVGKDLNIQILAKKSGKLIEAFKETKNDVSIMYRNKFDLLYIFKLRKFILDREIQIVHIHSGINFLFVYLATLFLDVKTVLTVHGHSLNKYKFLKKTVFRYIDQVLFVSFYLKSFFLSNNEIDERKINVVYNGIDKTKFVSSVSSFVSLDLPKNCIIAGMVGNFNDAKDQLSVCYALKKNILNNQNFHFIFVGGVQNSRIEKECRKFCEISKISKNVHFLGSRSDVPEILLMLDFFVYASNEDTFGIAVVEAMMSGIPVIVNDLPVFQEITENGNYAQLYKTKDKVDLAEKIEFFINHSEKRKELGDRGRKWALEHYTIEKHIERLHTIYTELLSD